eukprot:SAG11_NODE_6998_length_1211_cov_1.067446_1_plen_133_part_00
MVPAMAGPVTVSKATPGRVVMFLIRVLVLIVEDMDNVLVGSVSARMDGRVMDVMRLIRARQRHVCMGEAAKIRQMVTLVRVFKGLVANHVKSSTSVARVVVVAVHHTVPQVEVVENMGLGLILDLHAPPGME